MELTLSRICPWQIFKWLPFLRSSPSSFGHDCDVGLQSGFLLQEDRIVRGKSREDSVRRGSVDGLALRGLDG